MITVMVLGHKGLLGNCVVKYLSSVSEEVEVETTNLRWPDERFIKLLKDGNFDWVINCVALIPQSKPEAADLFTVNYGLPVFLSTLGVKVVHPSSNDLRVDTPYSLSKLCAEKTVTSFSNVHIIRSSIVGIEKQSSKSLLSWFLNNNSPSVSGYTNQEWNGVTTLTWAKLCFRFINGDDQSRIIVPFSDAISKFHLLETFREVFSHKIDIIPIAGPASVSTTVGDVYCGDLHTQLIDLRNLYRL